MVRRALNPLVLVLLILPLLIPFAPTAPAASGPGLVALAGDSRAVPLDAPIPLAGSARGGTGPYQYAWSFDGSGTRFGNPAAAATTFNTSGLPHGSVDLTLTVIDAVGAVAMDTVRMQVVGNTQSVTLSDSVTVGTVATHGPQEKAFTVPEGTIRIEARLEWTNALNDLDLHLLDRHGTVQGGDAAATGSMPERLTVMYPLPGTWTAQVQSFHAAMDRWTLTLTFLVGDPVPGIYAGGGSLTNTYIFGAADTQTLRPDVSTPDFQAIEWDLDNDGAYDDAAGMSPVASFAPGATYPISVRIVDLKGYRGSHATQVTVDATADHVLLLRCGQGSQGNIRILEFPLFGTCWGHIGHHHYWLGGDAYTLAWAQGRATMVEQNFAPPKDTTTGLRTFLQAEGSLDGHTWFPMGKASHAVLATRETVPLTFAPTENAFRYLRLVNPQSVTEGLSGYLDGSFLMLGVSRTLTPETEGPRAPGTRSLSCEQDIWERFFADHPCTFGGIDRYDSPSAIHTYPLSIKPSELTAVRGSVILAPWRTDDFFWPARYADQALDVTLIVEASVDGQAWRTVAEVPTTWGVRTHFNASFETPLKARFVRVHTDLHPGSALDAPLHHTKGYLLDSRLELDGNFPISV